MMCPKCAGKTIVVGGANGLVRERFRKCLSCGYTFQTIEAIKFDSFWGEYAKDLYEIEKKEFEKKDKDKKDG